MTSLCKDYFLLLLRIFDPACVFFREAILLFDCTQAPVGVSVDHAKASRPPSTRPILCGVTSWPNLLCDVNPQPSRTLPNGFVLCSRPTWYFPKPSIYCWSPVQVINGLTELWVSVTKKGHMLWAELQKESLDWKLSHSNSRCCLKVTIIFCSNVNLFLIDCWIYCCSSSYWTQGAPNIHMKCSESRMSKPFVYILLHSSLALAPHQNWCSGVVSSQKKHTADRRHLVTCFSSCIFKFYQAENAWQVKAGQITVPFHLRVHVQRL